MEEVSEVQEAVVFDFNAAFAKKREAVEVERLSKMSATAILVEEHNRLVEHVNTISNKLNQVSSDQLETVELLKKLIECINEMGLKHNKLVEQVSFRKRV